MSSCDEYTSVRVLHCPIPLFYLEGSLRSVAAALDSVKGLDIVAVPYSLQC